MREHENEKQASNVVVDSEGSSHCQGLIQAPYWSPEQEKRLVRRIDLAIMPLLILGFAVLQLDRSNIGNAMTDNFMKEVGITQFEYNVGNQLMYLGIVLFEIPSNLVLYKVGPAIWIGFQIVAWGLVATFQAFIKGHGYGPYIATRFLLGICECGYIPAGLYTMTRFYKKDEISKRFAVFFLGNMVANAGAGLLAFGILRMRGIANLSGWQWLFLLEGMLTIVIAVLFITLFPRSTSNPVSLAGLRHFTEEEAHIITQRVLLDDPTKKHAHTHVSREELRAVFTNWKLIAHVMTTLGSLSAIASLASFGPSIVASYGYKAIEANAMNSIGYWILIPVTLFWGWAADKWGKRGPMVMVGTFISFVFLIAQRCIAETDKVTAKYAIITVVYAFSFNWHPINGSWMALNAKSAGERSITMAILIMAANASGIVGGQIFQASDAPNYKVGWSVSVALSCIGFVSSVVANVQYWNLNRLNKKKGNTGFVYHP
ncbi:unnamed protein product [Clonostachys chloroleuca]|uniref:Major facilitator superfamily (MFS) profile domain-containing protein n=1 Tax=Clonostachys chloroleuca TaxID=1926264 RepID=A0AA35LRM7_9HYPO|nr:unnamed protein product [Clonostachys chloroleuca]